MVKKISVFWFRRDLRLEDNVGFSNALQGEFPVLPIFIFDKQILSKLPEDDARVSFIYYTLQKMQGRLQSDGKSSIALFYDSPEKVFKRLIDKYQIQKVYANHDYEPYAKERDKSIRELLSKNGVDFITYKDQVIFEKHEVVKDDSNPYVVYTPYKNKWKQKFNPKIDLESHSTAKYFNNLIKNRDPSNISLSQMGFIKSRVVVSKYTATPTLINNYEKTRNFPAIENGTSKLGPHLRFGTVSIRAVVKKAVVEENEVFWNELIWREFFMQILWHFPHTVNNRFGRNTTVLNGETMK